VKRRYEVFVHLKEGLADPQGKTIQEALPTLGFQGVSTVRVGKHIELTVDIEDPAKARRAVEEIAERVLSNPVIELFRVAERTASGPPGAEGDIE
jgi:phosphoribosylformylglycinamidine synthase subunit PurS